MGQFDTEVDLLMYDSISDAFRYAKLIGQHNDSESLQRYSNKLLEKWTVSQLQFFPNALRTLATWVVVAGNLFDQIIVQNELPISEMPPEQISSLFGNNEERIKEYIKEKKMTLINVIVEEIGETVMETCQTPHKENLLSSTKKLHWN